MKFFTREEAMIDKLQKWFRKRNWRRTFRIHFIVYGDFSLEEYLKTLTESYKLEALDGDGIKNQTIEIRIRPKQLHQVLNTLPDTVGVSYEQKEPERH